MPSPLDELKTTALIGTLTECRLFSGLPPQDLEAIAGFTVVKPLRREEYLFREGEKSHGIYVVQQGTINVHRVNAAGKEQVIRIFRAGESFAEAAMVTEKGYPADARAVENSQVLMVQKSGFLELLRNRPELALRMLGSMAMHLREVVSQLEDLTLKDVETRMANWLLKQCPDSASSNPVTIQLNVPKRVVAAELGTVSETFSRTLAKFRDQGLLSVDGKTLTILNPPELEQLFRQMVGEE